MVHLSYNAGYLGAVKKDGGLKFPKLVGNFKKGNLKGMIREFKDGMDGLKKRRAHEIKIFLHGDYTGRP